MRELAFRYRKVTKRELWEVEADDPARNRCGCFLPDLTRLATTPSADFRAPYGRKGDKMQAEAHPWLCR